MKHNNIIIISALALVISLTGCGNTNKLSEYDMTGISFIEYTDIDTVLTMHRIPYQRLQLPFAAVHFVF